MVKKQGIVWNYYDKKIKGSLVIVSCKFCGKTYNKNATRMERHIQWCPKCPEDIKQQFIQTAHNKKNKDGVLLIRVNNEWAEQRLPAEQGVTNAELKNFDNKNNECQSYSDTVPSQQIQRLSANLVMQNSDQSSVNYKTVVENNERISNPANINCNTNQNSTESVANDRSPERTSSVHQRKAHFPRKRAQRSFLSAVGYSLQNKILQEQLAERRALRKAAQLELRRKALELERLQWEYERDKIQNEIRWTHEIRMMKIKEKREKLLVEQSTP